MPSADRWGPGDPARAYALVESTGANYDTHNVPAVTHINTGQYCVELDSSIPNSSATALASPCYPSDSTNSTTFTHVEVEGTCGTNGLEVLTYAVSQRASALSVQLANNPFLFAVP